MFPPSACSVVTSPTPGAASFPPSASGAMRLTGIAAQVINGTPGGPSPGKPDYPDLFGVGIGLNFNAPGSGALVGFYDASAYTGISFEITFPSGVPQAHLRVQLPTMETLATGVPDYWGGAIAATSPVTPGTNTFPWAQVNGNGPFQSPAFNRTMIQAIQFAVYTDTLASIPVSFCINNLTLTK
jgi:hypothetical protein